MTIDSRYLLNAKASDGGTDYSFLFESIGSPAIEVFTITNGVRAQLVQFEDYNVFLSEYRNPVYKCGYVRLNEPLPLGSQISVERKTPITNSFESTALEPFQPEQFEHQLDRFTFILQEIEAHACDCRGEE